jgi:hypothetical protein
LALDHGVLPTLQGESICTRPDVQARRLLQPRRFGLGRRHAEEKPELARRDPRAREGRRSQGQVPDPAIQLHERLHPPHGDPQALDHIVGQARETELEIAGALLQAGEQAGEAQLDRVAHRAEAAQVAVEQEGRQVLHDVAPVVFPNRLQERLGDGRLPVGQAHGLPLCRRAPVRRGCGDGWTERSRDVGSAAGIGAHARASHGWIGA